MKKRKPCPSVHPTEGIQCWATEGHVDGEYELFHWAIVPPPPGSGKPLRVSWKDLTNA